MKTIIVFEFNGQKYVPLEEVQRLLNLNYRQVSIEEEFKDIPGYEGLYKVSNTGSVYSILGNRKLNGSDKGDGYNRVTLTKEGQIKRFNVHRLVMLAFIGPSDLQVNHIDGNKSNNCLDNLQYVSKSENMLHAYKTGLNVGLKGEDNAASKLTKKQVIEIKQLLKEGNSQSSIAKKYNVCQTNISKIFLGKIWNNVE